MSKVLPLKIRLINKYIIFAIFEILFFGKINAQKELKGKILNETDIEGVYISNLTTNYNTVTDFEGNFYMEVSVNDTLQIASLNYKIKKIPITNIVLKSGYISIMLEEFVNELNTVYVMPNLTGNIELDSKRVKTEEYFNYDKVGVPGFSGKKEERIVPILVAAFPTKVDIEAVYKHISGYYKKLKLRRKWDNENNSIASILFIYNSQFLNNAYSIPLDRSYDFILFCVESSNILQDFNNENSNGVLIILQERAEMYLSLLINKKE